MSMQVQIGQSRFLTEEQLCPVDTRLECISLCLTMIEVLSEVLSVDRLLQQM